jgi:hypothetical protein
MKRKHNESERNKKEIQKTKIFGEKREGVGERGGKKVMIRKKTGKSMEKGSRKGRAFLNFRWSSYDYLIQLPYQAP